ncbi:hypothetical protein [Aerosakkonema funiforme]|uniref:hypothetical protein n=1 Tax=Aerosakkonema funiforme TaxID=1246630 RepID=UPI0035B7CF17
MLDLFYLAIGQCTGDCDWGVGEWESGGVGVRFWYLGMASADDRSRYAHGSLRDR